MGYLIDIAAGAASRIIAGEIGAHIEPFARWNIIKAAERLPVESRDRFREEWLAHLDETPGTLRKLWHAAGCRWGAIKVGEVLQQQRIRLVTEDIELFRGLRVLMGKAKFGQVIKVTLDAVADVKGRPPDHDYVVARVIEGIREEINEPWARRLYRRWRISWMILRKRPVDLGAKLIGRTSARGSPRGGRT
jgi:hypothetical protein